MCWYNASSDTIGYQIKSLVVTFELLVNRALVTTKHDRLWLLFLAVPRIFAIRLHGWKHWALEHGDVPLMLTWWLHSYWLALILLEVSIYATVGGEYSTLTQLWPLWAIIMASPTSGLLLLCNSGTSVLRVTKHFLIGFIDCSLNQNSFLVLMTGSKPHDWLVPRL